jgi:histidinol-phosphate/aromatic aminotransferase/cobyric acid decarboxylase-like protein
VEAFISKRDVYRFGPNELFKTVNCYRFSAAFFRGAYLPFLRSYIEVCGKNSYYEEVLKVTMPVAANQLSAYEIPASDWMEIDDAEDLRRAEIVAETSPQEKARRLAAQFGGYWKTAGLQDLTLLENPFFPTPEFLSEFARQLPQALGMYPSTQSVICAVASKSSDFEPEQIVVGNGASELINILFQELEGNVNLVSPTFLEYQRAIGSRANIIQRTFPDTSYQSIVAESISNIKDHTVLVNPNNPTGEIVHRDTILKLASALRGQKKRLLIDESFIDFSDEQSCAQRELLRDFPNMLILRSFGKSYGVGGLRLGALFTADVAFAERLRARLPIWNISSFAEIFLDILPKYKTQYKESIERFKAERRLYLQKLQSVGLVVHQSAANFFLISLPDAIANRVCEGLLAQNLLVKRLERAGLRGTYIRIAIKDSRVNQKVVETLRAILRNN